MLTIRLRLGHSIDMIDGRPAPECISDLCGLLCYIANTCGVVEKDELVGLIVDRDEYGLDQRVEKLRVEVSMDWTEGKVMRCAQTRAHFVRAILNLLDEKDPSLDVIERFQVQLVIGGHELGVVYDRKDVEPIHLWMAIPLERALAGKDPFSFN